MKKCPYCAEEIQDQAIKCRYCGEWLKETKLKSVKDKNLIKKDKFEKRRRNEERNKGWWKRIVWWRRYFVVLAVIVFFCWQVRLDYEPFEAGVMSALSFFGGHGLFFFFLFEEDKRKTKEKNAWRKEIMLKGRSKKAWAELLELLEEKVKERYGCYEIYIRFETWEGNEVDSIEISNDPIYGKLMNKEEEGER